MGLGAPIAKWHRVGNSEGGESRAEFDRLREVLGPVLQSITFADHGEHLTGAECWSASLQPTDPDDENSVDQLVLFFDCRVLPQQLCFLPLQQFVGENGEVLTNHFEQVVRQKIATVTKEGVKRLMEVVVRLDAVSKTVLPDAE